MREKYKKQKNLKFYISKNEIMSHKNRYIILDCRPNDHYWSWEPLRESCLMSAIIGIRIQCNDEYKRYICFWVVSASQLWAPNDEPLATIKQYINRFEEHLWKWIIWSWNFTNDYQLNHRPNWSWNCLANMANIAPLQPLKTYLNHVFENNIMNESENQWTKAIRAINAIKVMKSNWI